MNIQKQIASRLIKLIKFTKYYKIKYVQIQKFLNFEETLNDSSCQVRSIYKVLIQDLREIKIQDEKEKEEKRRREAQKLLEM